MAFGAAASVVVRELRSFVRSAEGRFQRVVVVDGDGDGDRAVVGAGVDNPESMGTGEVTAGWVRG